MLFLECMHTQKPKAVNLSIIVNVWAKFVLNFSIFIGVYFIILLWTKYLFRARQLAARQFDWQHMSDKDSWGNLN